MNSPPDHNTLLAELGWVRRLARQLVGDVHLAEDLVQEVLVAALEGPSGQGQRFSGAPRLRASSA